MRVCHDADMVFDATRPDVVVRVRWFFVPEAAPVLGMPTPFAARSYWEEQREWFSDLGEEYLSTRINRGRAPPPDPRCVGGRPIGTPDQWLNGVAWPWDQAGCPGDPLPQPGPYSCAYSDDYQ